MMPSMSALMYTRMASTLTDPTYCRFPTGHGHLAVRPSLPPAQRGSHAGHGDGARRGDLRPQSRADPGRARRQPRRRGRRGVRAVRLRSAQPRPAPAPVQRRPRHRRGDRRRGGGRCRGRQPGLDPDVRPARHGTGGLTRCTKGRKGPGKNLARYAPVPYADRRRSALRAVGSA
ncbi:hypothetical protein SGPA1_12754 [Streptomyces misionensis JCM 4497]